MNRYIGTILTCFLVVILQSCGDKTNGTVWHAARAYYKNVPAIMDLPQPWVDGMILTDHLGGKKTTLQTWDQSRAIFIPDRHINKGELLQVQIKEPIPMASPCRIEEIEGKIIAHINGQEILSYAIETQLPSDTLPTYYQRSGFIHPLKTIKGHTITDGFPHGHTHQHGVFNAWTRSHFRGEMIDFWNQQAQLGTVRHVESLGHQKWSGLFIFFSNLATLGIHQWRHDTQLSRKMDNKNHCSCR